MRRRIALLGSTGSIGRATLDVVGRLRGAGIEIEVAALAARRDVATLAAQIRTFRPAAAALQRREDADALRAAVPGWEGEVLSGPEGLERLAAAGADLVVVAVEGVAGLAPTLAALGAGADVALATKEALVAGGALVVEAAVRAGRRLLPIDSEHSAIFQCLEGRPSADVARLWLTASGGPFRRTPADAMAKVTREDALRHPTWQMGPKVTVDSATLMNKGLEIIEAHWLFGVAPERIDVVIHPQSIVHSCVELVDGSILAQLGPADMRLPIQAVLTYPHRVPQAIARLDLRALGALEFEAPDEARFPCLGLARDALRRGGTAPAALNAANEAAVRLFLDDRIGFTDIAPAVRRALDAHVPRPAASLADVIAADREARAAVQALCAA
ncbi:MAG TPA: 1-deoxy-D-xylulose-5-phosphate reductoisomerase [bacterium]|nr:1-deoxy-D-xylulose-5-phosphate reductoisomerase [bacterium]